jgi:hypothetical protein
MGRRGVLEDGREHRPDFRRAATKSTLGQTEILQNNGQVRLQDMQNLTYHVHRRSGHRPGLLHPHRPADRHDADQARRGRRSTGALHPGNARGRFPRLHVLDPAVQHGAQDPEKKVRRIMEFISTGMPAIAQAYQLLGPMLNIENIVNLVSREVGHRRGRRNHQQPVAATADSNATDAVADQRHRGGRQGRRVLAQRRHRPSAAAADATARRQCPAAGRLASPTRCKWGRPAACLRNRSPTAAIRIAAPKFRRRDSTKPAPLARRSSA